MSIFVDEKTKVVYQGLTGSQGTFYGLRNQAYGTQVVAGTHPKKAGTDVQGIPVYASVGEAVAETGATEQKQMGQVMKALMPKVAGRADGKRVSAAVRAALGA